MPAATSVFEPLPIPANILPERLPQHWTLVKGASCPEFLFWRGPKGLKVGLGLGLEADGRRWLHGSISAAKRLPTYDELATLKRVWMGTNRKAIQVFPEASQHVNFHPFCLHLWACLDDDPLPDFSRGIGVV